MAELVLEFCTGWLNKHRSEFIATHAVRVNCITSVTLWLESGVTSGFCGQLSRTRKDLSKSVKQTPLLLLHGGPHASGCRHGVMTWKFRDLFLVGMQAFDVSSLLKCTTCC